ncbi:MAG: cytochrome b, partial [Alphaproteobacteria bacterium]
HKSNNPLGIDVKGPQDSIPFHPYYTVKDLVGLGVFLIVLAALVFFTPNMLGEFENYNPANRLVTPPHIVPEWYLTPFYAILRAIPHKLGGVVAMFGSIFVLFLLPWLDTSKVRSAKFRPIYKQVFWFLVIDVIVLWWVGANRPDADFHGIPFLAIGRVATAYYFLHFLVIMPVLGKLERTRALPDSIATAVLKGRGAPAEEPAPAAE